VENGPVKKMRNGLGPEHLLFLEFEPKT